MAASEPQPLASLSLFHVHYNPTDPLSHISAYLALLPQSLLGSNILHLYTTRELELIFLLTGQLACEALNFALKRLIKEERPDLIREVKRGYGMPSSHAQFVGFWGVYVCLFLWVRLRPGLGRGGGWGGGGDVGSKRRVSGGVLKNGPMSPAVLAATAPMGLGIGNGESEVDSDVDGVPAGSGLQPYTHSPSPILNLQLRYPLLKNMVLTFVVAALALSTAYSRIYLSYHTPKQVAVGLIAGFAFGAAYFLLVSWLRWSGWTEWFLELGIVRMARIRDLVGEEDLVEIGWRVWEEKRAAKRMEKRRKSGLKKVRVVDPKTGNGARPEDLGIVRSAGDGRKRK